jgi:hypothetical protein
MTVCEPLDAVLCTGMGYSPGYFGGTEFWVTKEITLKIPPPQQQISRIFGLFPWCVFRRDFDGELLACLNPCLESVF